MRMNRVTLVAMICCVMALAAANAGAQITDPGDVGGHALAPAGNSDDGFHPIVTVMPWRSTVLALRSSFAPVFRIWSGSSVWPARMTTRGGLRHTGR
jgi:hypothetical protein